MLAVGISGELVYPVDKGSGSITTLSNADGIIEIAAGVEYLEQGSAVEVKLFGELEHSRFGCGWRELSDTGEAGREPAHPCTSDEYRKRTRKDRPFGRVGGSCMCIRLEGCSSGLTSIKSYKRELGFIFRDESALQDLESRGSRGLEQGFAYEEALRASPEGFRHFQSEVRAPGKDAFICGRCGSLGKSGRWVLEKRRPQKRRPWALSS